MNAGVRRNMGNPTNIIVSKGNKESDWDQYVNNHEMGQYQQTSIWARAKESEGWSHSRVMIKDENGDILGGFQLLKKNIYKFITIGFISKAPLYGDADDEIFMKLYDAIIKEMTSNNITVLILQNDDRDKYMCNYLKTRRFHENRMVEIQSATSTIDLRPSIDHIWDRMNRTRKQEIKKAGKIFQFVLGSKSDLRIFFELMEKSCRRINEKPNISSYDALCKVWETLSASGMIEVFLVKLNEKIITSLITISYKNELHLWRYGWSGECHHFNPNAFLYWEIIRWAKERGYVSVDLGGIDRSFAFSWLNKLPFPKNNLNSLFKMKFGGDIKIMPESLIFFRRNFGNNIYAKVMNSKLSKYVTDII